MKNSKLLLAAATTALIIGASVSPISRGSVGVGGIGVSVGGASVAVSVGGSVASGTVETIHFLLSPNGQ